MAQATNRKIDQSCKK